MQQLLPCVWFLAGLIMITKGSDMFIDASIWIARVTKIPDLIIGATLVSIGTTLPEVMVSASSALRGNTEIALGNALGSIACNTGLVLAITIILSQPELMDKHKFQKKGIFLVLLLIVLSVVGLAFGEVSRLTGIIFLGILVWYLIKNVHESLQDNRGSIQDRNQTVRLGRKKTAVNLTMFTIGFALTLWGSSLLVTNGEKIALFLGVPDIVIGLTMTAFGTSLPELMTAITALRKNVQDISLGNILGANILNIILVIALSATISPIPMDTNILQFHLPFIFFIVGSTVAFSFVNESRFRRRNGFLLLISYIVYVLLVIGIF